MQRVIGALLIITATSGAGYLYGAELRRYLDRMLYIRYIAGLIKGEMEYTGAPLPEIFRGIGSRAKEPYATWLKNISAEIDLREESAFARIWNRGVDRYLKELGLKSVHSILLKEMGTFLGQSDRDTLGRSMQMYRETAGGACVKAEGQPLAGGDERHLPGRSSALTGEEA